MKDSRPLSTTLREPVAFRHSSGGEVVMPSHSPREGGWLALCLVACARRSHVCLSMSIYLSTFLSLSLCRNRLVVCPDCGGISHQSHSPHDVGQIVMMTECHITIRLVRLQVIVTVSRSTPHLRMTSSRLMHCAVDDSIYHRGR